MFCIGIGEKFKGDTSSIKILASKPVHNHTIKTSYSSLNKTKKILFDKLSHGKCHMYCIFNFTTA